MVGGRLYDFRRVKLICTYSGNDSQALKEDDMMMGFVTMVERCDVRSTLC